MEFCILIRDGKRYSTQDKTRNKKSKKKKAFSFVNVYSVITKQGHSPTEIHCPFPSCVLWLLIILVLIQFKEVYLQGRRRGNRKNFQPIENIMRWHIFFIFHDCSETYIKPSQTSKMELFAEIVNGLKALTIPQKAPSQMLDLVLNTPLCQKQRSQLFHRTRVLITALITVSLSLY